MEPNRKYDSKVYDAEQSCVFRKTKEQFGGLSNMASGFPLRINNIPILSSEALYQACRFPSLPDVQSKILNQRSPMTAKMVGKPFREDTRADWEDVRIKIMRWCLKVKLAQNYFEFGKLLESTFDKQIVEDSSKDDFWGAVRDKSDNDKLIGVNALGRLLMEIRHFYNEHRFSYNMFVVEPLSIPDFLLFGHPIQVVDERINFISHLERIMHCKEAIKINYTVKPSILSEEVVIISDIPTSSLNTLFIKDKTASTKKVAAPKDKPAKRKREAKKVGEPAEKAKGKATRKSSVRFLKDQPMLPLS
ncbi:DUF1768 domain-containing protein [Hymenobacter sp. HMF4947]|uniref:DUF1768 domain-containing protein n=1 Tax=Hymenobacter ginkgonis TaxID=2682976 RepID=A0A7K1TLB5_9BACT|nr:NADAR family protein [Hymenobacter ginkgonis]MVN79204.1 DUF1768 domain-containing protein [Hymenobacter ginkgonis]